MAQLNVNDILSIKESKNEDNLSTRKIQSSGKDEVSLSTRKIQSSGKVVSRTYTENKIVNITLDGGIIGLLASSPKSALNDVIEYENSEGWKVIQVIPADSGNLFLSIFRLVLLLCTFLMYTTANGYYVIMERTQTDGHS